MDVRLLKSGWLVKRYTYKVYRNVEFKAQSFEQQGGTTEYYYKHLSINSQGDSSNMLQCFNCIVNRNNMEYDENNTEINRFKRAYNIGLARERYIQMQRTRITDSKATTSKQELDFTIIIDGNSYNGSQNITVEKGKKVKLEVIVVNGSGEYRYNWENDTIMMTVGAGEKYEFVVNGETQISCGIVDMKTMQTKEKSVKISIKN